MKKEDSYILEDDYLIKAKITEKSGQSEKKRKEKIGDLKKRRWKVNGSKVSIYFNRMRSPLILLILSLIFISLTIINARDILNEEDSRDIQVRMESSETLGHGQGRNRNHQGDAVIVSRKRLCI